MEFEPMLTPREKSPLPENFPRGGSNPRRCGQWAQTLPTSYSSPQIHSNVNSVERGYRYTVKDLLQHDFFLEDSGLKVELVNREDEASNKPDIQLRLRVVDAKKRKDKHKENEAIQFDFNILTDQAEEVSQELVKVIHFLSTGAI